MEIQATPGCADHVKMWQTTGLLHHLSSPNAHSCRCCSTPGLQTNFCFYMHI